MHLVVKMYTSGKQQHFFRDILGSTPVLPYDGFQSNQSINQLKILSEQMQKHCSHYISVGKWGDIA